MKKIFLIIICLAAALFLLPGVMGSEGWGETLDISGEVTVAEETPGDDAESGSANSDSPDSNSNSPQQKQIKPNTDTEDDNIIWIVDMNLD